MRRALPLILCVAVTACGSGGPKRLSRAEYAKQADAICARYNAQARALGTPTTTAEFADVAARTLPLLERAQRELRTLRPPKEEQILVGRLFALLRRLRADVAELRDRARANDLNGIHAVAPRAQKDDSAFLQTAGRLGMRVCSRPA